MPERISTKIRRYCELNGVIIPPGFDRHPASRYVIIERTEPPKLVARTWFNQADVIYYLEYVADDVPRQILDFAECDELQYDRRKSLKRIGRFDVS